MVNLDDSDTYVLVEFDNIEWMGNPAIGHLGDMYKSIVVDTNINEGTKVGDVCNNSR